MRVIAGDIGGTKVLLELLEVGPGTRQVIVERRYESALFPTFESMLTEFTRTEPGEISAACFAVAGPVLDGRSEITNLRWVIEAHSLQEIFSIPTVSLMNDFAAIAVGVPLLNSDDLRSLNRGVRDRTMPMAILGAGTGLGEAIVLPDGDGWRTVPSEGGHCDFAPSNQDQMDLLKVLQERYGHVSFERVVSGMGLVNIFTFLRDRQGSSASVDRRFSEDHADIPAILSELAGQGDPFSVQAFGMFVDAYGAEAGNLALKVLARGGVYLAGGIVGKNLERFTDGRFMRSFADKGRFRELMMDFPVDAITNQKVGLIGAAAVAARSATNTDR
ncbi:MAG: glucokinase [Acidobacteriota bacterium]